MELHFNNIRPKAFSYRNANDSLWGQDIKLTPSGVYQIVASSGSGKSTLVAILSGLRNDYDGSLFIENNAVSSYRSKAWSLWRSEYASFVYQDLRLFPELTAKENIRLAAELNKNNLLQPEILMQMATSLGVDAKLDILVKKLSYGQMQRVAIIRSLSRNYKWLILDEPFSHLDMDNAQKAWKMIITDAHAKRAGVIITSLDPYPFIQPDKVFIL